MNQRRYRCELFGRRTIENKTDDDDDDVDEGAVDDEVGGGKREKAETLAEAHMIFIFVLHNR